MRRNERARAETSTAASLNEDDRSGRARHGEFGSAEGRGTHRAPAKERLVFGSTVPRWQEPKREDEPASEYQTEYHVARSQAVGQLERVAFGSGRSRHTVFAKDGGPGEATGSDASSWHDAPDYRVARSQSAGHSGKLAFGSGQGRFNSDGSALEGDGSDACSWRQESFAPAHCCSSSHAAFGSGRERFKDDKPFGHSAATQVTAAAEQAPHHQKASRRSSVQRRERGAAEGTEADVDVELDTEAEAEVAAAVAAAAILEAAMEAEETEAEMEAVAEEVEMEAMAAEVKAKVGAEAMEPAAAAEIMGRRRSPPLARQLTIRMPSPAAPKISSQPRRHTLSTHGWDDVGLAHPAIATGTSSGSSAIDFEPTPMRVTRPVPSPPRPSTAPQQKRFEVTPMSIQIRPTRPLTARESSRARPMSPLVPSVFPLDLPEANEVAPSTSPDSGRDETSAQHTSPPTVFVPQSSTAPSNSARLWDSWSSKLEPVIRPSSKPPALPSNKWPRPESATQRAYLQTARATVPHADADERTFVVYSQPRLGSPRPAAYTHHRLPTSNRAEASPSAGSASRRTRKHTGHWVAIQQCEPNAEMAALRAALEAGQRASPVSVMAAPAPPSAGIAMPKAAHRATNAPQASLRLHCQMLPQAELRHSAAPGTPTLPPGRYLRAMLTERPAVRGRPPATASSLTAREARMAALRLSADTSSPANLDRHYARRRALLRLQGFDPSLGWQLQVAPAAVPASSDDESGRR